MIVSVISECFK